MAKISSHVTRARELSAEQIALYRRDGMLRVPGLFDVDEFEPLRRAFQDDPTINGALYGMVDEEGESHPICIWTELADDIIGMIPRMARIARSCRNWSSFILDLIDR